MKSIVTRLWLTLVISVAVILILLGLFLSQLFDSFYFDLQADNLIAQGQNLSRLVLTSGDSRQLLRELALVEDFLKANVLIMDKSGLVSNVSPGLRHHQRRGGQMLTPPQAAAVLSGQIVVIKGYRLGQETTTLAVAVPITTTDKVVGAVYLYTPLAPITRTIASVRRLIAYGILGTLFMATIMAFFLSRRLSRPLIRMEHAAQTMASGDFSPRVPEHARDEVGRLGVAFNHLAAKLARTLADLEAERDQLAEILAGMTDGVVTFSADGKLQIYNPPAAEYLAPAVELALGQRLGEEIVQADLQKSVQQVVFTGEPQGTEFEFGGRILVARLAPLKSGDKVRAVVCVLFDLTKERRLEAMRREFVANVSHELRTPLTYLQGYTEAILDGLAASKEEEEKYLHIILDETLRLRRLVNDLLDLSLIEAGQLVLNQERVVLKDLFDQVRQTLLPLAKDKNVNLTVRQQENLPPVWADPDRLQQILINLLSNALRYTPAGGTVKAEAALHSADRLKITVSDTGIGIAPANLPYIFERFYKQEQARASFGGGTGIGLAIVKGLVEAHGGEIWVNSQPGAGTIFTFTLPLADFTAT
ncbi:MAG: cell wall metabolism sensor histidine kinase WalK [Firmicutes bacterium]|nr:cell wall metabolism sensor histidine kinase WalK [Bacillota bacterium]